MNDVLNIPERLRHVREWFEGLGLHEKMLKLKGKAAGLWRSIFGKAEQGAS